MFIFTVRLDDTTTDTFSCGKCQDAMEWFNTVVLPVIEKKTNRYYEQNDKRFTRSYPMSISCHEIHCIVSSKRLQKTTEDVRKRYGVKMAELFSIMDVNKQPHRTINGQLLTNSTAMQSTISVA